MMRFGLQLLMVALLACLVTVASADEHEASMEDVDAGAMADEMGEDSPEVDEAFDEEFEADAWEADPDETPVDTVEEAPANDDFDDAEWDAEWSDDTADADAWAADSEEVADADDAGNDDAFDMTEVETVESAGIEEEVASEPVIEEGTSVVVNGVELGPVGIDGEGRVGRVHTVKPGDTLWDISHAYLGTSWVWPSVWQKDNDGIENPHLISPGDQLWISSTEIRPITSDEADAYVAEAELAVAEEPVAAEVDEFAEAEPIEEDPFFDMAAMDEFASEEMEQLPVGMSDAAAANSETGRVVRVSMRENMSFVSDVQLEASTSILESPSNRRFLTSEDTIYFGLGEGEVEVGDEFTLFRNITEVRSPSNKSLIGYHVDVLGWAEVVEVTGDTCVAVIRVSIDGAVRGDYVMPRYQTPTDIAVKYAQEDVDGEIVFLPASRTLMGTTDYVFLDVGAVHGVEIGTDLEVYDRSVRRYDAARDAKFDTPNRVVADLVVVTVQEESSVAFVAHTRRELAVGDSVRGATRDFPEAF